MTSTLLLILLSASTTTGPGSTSMIRKSTLAKSLMGPYFTPDTNFLFKLAPANGAGMGSACACTDITDGKGQAVFSNRNSIFYCTRGSENTNIANGNIVECPANKPIVMPGRTGVGNLGVAVWGQRVNSAIRAQQFDNVGWVISTFSSTVTRGAADTDIAPDGTLSAEQLTFSATLASSSQYASVIQSVLTNSGLTWSGSVYAKGNATSPSGTYDICLDNNLPGYSCSVCTFVADTWTRCCIPNVNSVASGNIYIGNLSLLTGVNRPAQTITLWNGQAEVGPTCSPPIRTVATAVTRQPENLGGPSPLNQSPQPATWCVGGTVDPNELDWRGITSPVLFHTVISVGNQASPNYYALFVNQSSKLQLNVYDNSGAQVNWMANSSLSVAKHRLLGCGTSTGSLSLYVDGVVAPGSFTTPNGGTGIVTTQPSTFSIGMNQFVITDHVNMVLTDICIDNDGGCVTAL